MQGFPDNLVAPAKGTISADPVCKLFPMLSDDGLGLPGRTETACAGAIVLAIGYAFDGVIEVWFHISLSNRAISKLLRQINAIVKMPSFDPTTRLNVSASTMPAGSDATQRN
jgi:hypothetical protein